MAERRTPAVTCFRLLPSSQTNTIPTVAEPRTLREHEAALILQTLQDAGGMIGGPRGAAARLGVKRTTLVSKMKRLGIYRPRHHRITSESEDRNESSQSIVYRT